MRNAIVVLTALLISMPTLAIASWAPQNDEWAGFRSDPTHTGALGVTSLFTPGVGGPAKVKWQKDTTLPVLYPPPVADLDRDGVKEVVVTNNDVKTQVGPPPDIQFQHRVDVLGGANGDTQWSADETNSFALFGGANVVDVDPDAQAEVLYFRGNPLTGTSATNNFVARSHAGAQQWQFASALDWGSTQHPVGVLSATQAANLDGEANNEAVVGVVLADLLVTTGAAGPGCPNPNAQKIIIEASNIHYFLYALDGETSSPTAGWSQHVNPGLLASTPALLDLDGDGDRDVVWGSGGPQGVLIPSCSAEVRADASAVDNRILAVDGAGNSLWTRTLQDPVGVNRPVPATPTVAGTTAGGDPVLAFLILVAPSEPAANDPDRNLLLALNGRTGQTLWSLDLRPATTAPLAAADLDGDGQPELLVQLANRLVALRNDGTNFWPQGTDAFRGIAYARLLSSTGVAVADVDTDGTPEVLTILDGARGAGNPMAELLVVSGSNGAVEWTFPLLQDDVLGGPVVADIDGDDALAEIIVGGGSFTLGDTADHAGKVLVLEPNAPDLSLTGLELIGNRVRGDPQTVRATLVNEGTRDAASAVLRLLDNGVPVGADQTLALAAGATQTLDFAWTPSTKGAHTLRVVADPGGAIRELSETNNARELAVTILARFDLQVTNADVAFTPSNPALGDAVTVKATVRNAGEVATPAANLLRFEEAGIPFTQDKTIPVLNPGASTDVTVAFTVAEERTHHWVVTADPQNALNEEREDNNVASKNLAVRVIRADLSIVPADITFSNPNPALGDTVTLTATVRNLGNKDAPASKARILESGTPLGADLDVPALAQGASTNLQKTFTINEEREHLLTVNLDPDHLVLESDETNNVATKSLPVRFTAPDLVAVSLAPSPGIADPGQPVTLTATFRNGGDRALAGFSAEFFDGPLLLGTVAGVPLDIGQSATLTFSWTATLPRDVHALRVHGTPAALEQRSDNNEATTNVVVGALDVLVVPDQAVHHPDDAITATVVTRFAGTSLPAPNVPVTVDVRHETDVPGLHVILVRATVTGTTGANGEFTFEVPKTLLGGGNVCVNGNCVVDQGRILGQGTHLPGTYNLLAHADRLGFDFHGTGGYEVVP